MLGRKSHHDAVCQIWLQGHFGKSRKEWRDKLKVVQRAELAPNGTFKYVLITTSCALEH